MHYNIFQGFNIVDNIKECLKWQLQLVCKMHTSLTLYSKLCGLLNYVVFNFNNPEHSRVQTSVSLS